MKNENRGITSLVIAIIIGVVVAAAGVGGYFGWRVYKAKKAETFSVVTEDGSLEWADEFGSLDFSVSGLGAADVPDLALSGDLDFALPDIDLSGLSGVDLDLTAPDVGITAPEPDLGTLTFDLTGLSALTEQAGPPSGAGPPADVSTVEDEPTGEPPAEEPSSEPSPESQANAGNCAPFAAMPSASYCSQVGDPNGRELCEDCKAAGY
ncbi:hypothetical protein AMJ57_00215 [Parcubacteria bacterium SG8_24]|nr:MAG: hypothetical protein AMJ57_00215 [Parcubacteria bacterium SG8_24]